MKAIRVCCVSLALSILSGLSAQIAVADEAATIYDPSTVVFVDISLSAAEEAKLEAAPDVYVKGTFSMTKSSDGTPAGEEPAPFVSARPVEVRLKGSLGGSFRDLTGKAAFKLKFKKTDAVLGLRKMTLNNMVQDRSMVHETLAYAAFREAGVPASRTGFAYVRVNGEDFGLYLNLETLDDIALVRMFGAFDDETQHLYEGELGADVVPGGAADFEVDEGSDEITDLEALIEAVHSEGDGPWSDRVAANADLAEMVKMWAVEKYIDHWDGYSGHTEPGLQRPNNYYLYSEPSGRFQMLPWGTDQTWIPTIGVGTPQREVTFDGHGGVLFDECLDDAECFRAYWEALQSVTGSIASLDPGALAEDTADLLAPWQQEEREHGRAEYDAGDVEDGVEETLDFIAGRGVEAEEWLGDNVPPPRSVPAQPSPSVPTIPPSGQLGPALILGRSQRTAGVLTTHLQLAKIGIVKLKATMKTSEGDTAACSDRVRVARVGPLAVHCRLSPLALTRLTRGALSLRLTVRLALPGVSLDMVKDQIRLPRD
jgi:CotH protein